MLILKGKTERMRAKISWIAFVCLLLGQKSLAQSDTLFPQSYLFADLALSLNSTKDELVSPLLYSGVHTSVRTGFARQTNKNRWEVSFLYSTGNLGSRAATVQREKAPTLQRFQLQFNYFFMLPSLSFKKWQFGVGPHVELFIVYRNNPEFDNAAFTFDHGNVLGVSGLASRIWVKKERKRSLWFLKWKQKPHRMQWDNQLSVGAVGWASRPTYQTITNYTGNEITLADLLYSSDNLFFGSVNKIVAISSQSSLAWEFFNGNQLKLNYHWNYYRLKNTSQDGQNQSEGSMNQLSISFFYAL